MTSENKQVEDGDWYEHSCTMILELPKEERDYDTFGEYQVKLGSRKYADPSSSGWTSFGQFDTSYYLAEPDYEELAGGEEAFQEFHHTEIEFKNFDIDVAQDLGFNGRGQQSVYVELLSNEMVFVDDMVRIYMDLELPEDALTDGTVVFQYIQLLAEGSVEGTDDYISAGCKITIGEEDSEEIINYYGTQKLDAASQTGKTLEEFASEEKDLDDVFQRASEEWVYYGAWETGVGTKFATCVLELPISKGEDRDEDIFLTYKVTKGALLFSSADDTQPKQIGEKQFKMNLGEADYDPSSIIDSEILDLFEIDNDEKWDEDYVETEISFNGSTEATIDTATVLGDATAVAKQEFYSIYESNTIIDMDDEITFYFEADLPMDKLTDGAWVAQIVTLTPTNDPSTNISIGCFVQVGNPYGYFAQEWVGSADMDFGTNGSVSMSEINSAELVADSEVWAIDEPDFYELKESDSSFKNKLQACEAKIPVEKQGADSAIFTTYNAKLQLRIYASKDDTSPLNLSETDF